MKKLVLPFFFAVMLSLGNSAKAAEDTRCYELRTYHAAPGKLDALNARFRDHTCKIFEKHGMVNIGYWEPLDNTDNLLIYIIAHASREAADKSWRDFGADPEWKEVAKASEANGKLVTRVERVFMNATDYSNAIKLSASGQPRVFELRTYKASDGNLGRLHARFRNHTMRIFTRHGMTNVGYWSPLDKDKGSGDTLIYILSHKSKDAAEASWKAFREDPEWVKVKAASEKEGGGSLTPAAPKSVFMKPTDYSPMR